MDGTWQLNMGDTFLEGIHCHTYIMLKYVTSSDDPLNTLKVDCSCKLFAADLVYKSTRVDVQSHNLYKYV